jgi:hypothetical protein
MAKTKSTTQLAIVWKPTASLTPHARNARTHGAAQVAQIAASIKSFGWTNPVLVDTSGNIIAGHGRVLAAAQLGMSDVPTITLPDMTEERKRAYMLADNKLALNAGWNEELLREEIKVLADTELAPLTGFHAGEIASLMTAPGEELTQSEIAEEHWVGMPEHAQVNLKPHQSIIVHFDKAEDVEAFSKLIGVPLTERTRHCWYPLKENYHRAGKKYA